MKHNRTRRHGQLTRHPRLIENQQLSWVIGGGLDNAPINVVSDYNPDDPDRPR
jgi:hypothetical protein